MTPRRRPKPPVASRKMTRDFRRRLRAKTAPRLRHHRRTKGKSCSLLDSAYHYSFVVSGPMPATLARPTYKAAFKIRLTLVTGRNIFDQVRATKASRAAERVLNSSLAGRISSTSPRRRLGCCDHASTARSMFKNRWMATPPSSSLVSA